MGSESISRYFDHSTAAERYAAARPYMHPQILQRICAAIGCDRFGRALDVGCGTGQSTQALAEMAEYVVGIDPSEAMLGHATRRDNIEYRDAAAEALPLDDISVELITVGLAWHWFDAAAFLSEAQRVLQPRGWLAVYNNFFTGELPECPQFREWHRDRYLTAYPTPARQRRSPQSVLSEQSRLSFVQHDQFTVSVPMSQTQFVQYLLTQSNVIAHVEMGAVSLEVVCDSLLQETAAHFEDAVVAVPFLVEFDLLRRQ